MTPSYASFIARIQRASAPDDIRTLEKSLDRIYNAGQLTVAEFSRLDLQIVRRSAEIKEQTP